MPTPTYTLIDSVTLTSSASSVTFSSISATGKGDLFISVDALHATQNSVQSIRFNGDSANYYMVSMLGDGSSAQSYSGSDTLIYSETPVGTATRANYTFQIQDFSASDKHKSVLIRGNRSDANTSATAGRWASTSAITSLVLFPAAGSYAATSTFHLYQIVSE